MLLLQLFYPKHKTLKFPVLNLEFHDFFGFMEKVKSHIDLKILYHFYS